MNMPVMVIEPKSRFKLIDFTELWSYRSLFWQFAKRDVSLRYKQAVMGIAWAVLQPLLPAIIFAIVFGIFMKAPSDGQPYLLFVFTGMVIWNFFSQVLLRAGNSLTANANLITKVYFPRIVIPLASTGAVLFDLLISCVLLGALMLIYNVYPSWRLIFLPVVILLAFVSSAGISLWFSALNVKYRDFMYALPFIVQVWLYATPIVYSSSVVPQQWQILFSLNPAVGLVEGARWAVLGGSGLTTCAFAVSVSTSIFFFVSGLWYFQRMERSFADVI